MVRTPTRSPHTKHPQSSNPRVEGVFVCGEVTAWGSWARRYITTPSFPTVMALIGELLALGSPTVTRRNEIADMRHDLTAYFLLRPPPRDSA